MQLFFVQFFVSYVVVFTCTRNSTGLKIPESKGFLTKRLISDLDFSILRFYRRGGNGSRHWY